MKYKIGIVGVGFVGSAIAHGFAQFADIKMYDKYNDSYNSLYEVVNESDIIFVSVPTPMQEDGTQDLSNLDDAIENIVITAYKPKIIIIKSTVLPGTTKNYAYKYADHDFVFSPEFLTERTAKIDFINPTSIILGGIHKHSDSLKLVRNLFQERFSGANVFVTCSDAAELVKYILNSFFAVKISFFNEIYDMAKFMGVDYDEVKAMVLADSRIADSHCDVPGHDGDRGFGGKCFPKDVNALVTWAEDQGLHADIVKITGFVNERIRKSKDWLKIKGATSVNNYH
ncbi:MAG: UDP-glucose/GDP-mannose dehydrogenase family protein [Desulfobacterales bacterium]|nr:UDP-glucose/GDP-mannose dehydrogenase family protein [Desulfobacterales bacterium]MCP4163557.1 UDP-glucose/GDP-mannose dehydrogenase family protein [Deltaproteobacteria bacterium]